MSESLLAGIDAGGTTFKCIVGSGPDHILAEHRVSVTEPEETMQACVEFFRKAQSRWGSIGSLGIGCFGPIDIKADSPNYGQLLTTPKRAWQGVNVRAFFRQALQLEVLIDTDVNAALLGECTWGAGRGLHSAVYVTVGTGIGVAAKVDEHILHGVQHLEAGHMRITRHRDDNFSGVCPFHGDCAEGLASAPAIAQRWQCRPEDLSLEHPAWSLQAHYLASLCMNLTLAYSPQKIILGGGVMQREPLLERVRSSVQEQMGDYMDTQICAAGLADRAGALGALALVR